MNNLNKKKEIEIHILDMIIHNVECFIDNLEIINN